MWNGVLGIYNFYISISRFSTTNLFSGFIVRQDRLVCVLCNLKPAAMRGIKSHAMVLAASNSDHTKVSKHLWLMPNPCIV